MKTIWFAAIVAGLLVSAMTPAAEEEPKGSVLVETKATEQGSIPDTLDAYGTAAPAINAGMTLSVQAEGRVTRILVTPGEAVHTGQPLIEFRLSAAASSTYAQAVTALKLAQDERTRISRLLEQQLATRDQKAVADKAAADAQSALDALERETGGKAQQTLVAPFDGLVSTVPVAQGDRLAAGAPLVTVTRSNGLVVTVGVEPSDSRRVKLGQVVHIKPLSGGDDEPLIEGKVSRIDKSLNPKTRLVDADIVVADELIQGEAFSAQIEVGELGGWLVPRDAVLDDEDGSYIFQVAGAKAKRITVRRIGSDDETAVVDGPLDPKLKVVTVGNYQLEDGGAVRVQKTESGDKDKGAASGKEGRTEAAKAAAGKQP
jgi:RND family efflux transporter MFP subunit